MKDKFYPITSLHKDDIRSLQTQNKNGDIIPKFSKSSIDKLTDNDMEQIASKLANDYCEQLYWSSLEIIVEIYLEQKKKK